MNYLNYTAVIEDTNRIISICNDILKIINQYYMTSSSVGDFTSGDFLTPFIGKAKDIKADMNLTYTYIYNMATEIRKRANDILIHDEDARSRLIAVYENYGGI